MSELKTVKDIHVMITEFPDGIVIGWDSCSACFTSVKNCKCKGGPQHPKVFDRWLAGEDNMPRYNDPDRHKPNATPKASKVMETAVAAAAEKVEDALDDLPTLKARIDDLQAQADQELGTNGKTPLFLELKDKLTPLFEQANKMMEAQHDGSNA